MGKALSFVGRFGPLVAALAVGLGGLLDVVAPGAAPLTGALVAILGFLGAAPDAVLTSEITAIAASALLVYGGIRKVINLIKTF
jgi:hypothetical protein